MKALKILISLLTLFFFLMLSFNFLLNSESFSQYQLVKHDSYERVDNAFEVNKAVSDYLLLKTDHLLITGFNDREEKHLLDVRLTISLLNSLMLLAFFSSTALIAFILRKENSSKPLFFEVAKICFIILIAVVFISLISFSFLFTGFHQLVFETGTWLFNSNDLLIRLYPKTFFKDFFQNILILTTLYNALLLIVSKTK